MRFFVVFIIWAGTLQADPVVDVADAARAAFDRMPDVVVVDQIAGVCGADDTVNAQIAYCTTSQRILLASDAYGAPEAAYLVAHSYGHAVQVQHGVADFALRQIRTRRTEEVMLRGLVERQVDCIAGFLMARAGLQQTDLATLFDADPFAGAHWGRNPLRLGPEVSVELSARAEWFAIGQSGDLAACAPGEFASDLLVAALRS